MRGAAEARCFRADAVVTLVEAVVVLVVGAPVVTPVAAVVPPRPRLACGVLDGGLCC